MLSKLFRPKWQHPNTAVRARAVAEGKLSATEYFDIALNDAAIEVREQAIQQISSIESLLTLADKSPELQAAVATHLFNLVIDNSDQEDATLTKVLEVIDDDQQRRSLAQQAQSPQVRLAAVRTIGDENLLKEAALHDKAVDVRRVALERIDTERTLSEIAKLSRGRDKTIAKFAEQRLSEIRGKQQRGDHRQDLLREMDKLVGVTTPIDELSWQRLLADWESLKHEASVDEQQQFATSRAQIDVRLAEQQRLAREDSSRKAAREDLLQRLRHKDSPDRLVRSDSLGGCLGGTTLSG